MLNFDAWNFYVCDASQTNIRQNDTHNIWGGWTIGYGTEGYGIELQPYDMFETAVNTAIEFAAQDKKNDGNKGTLDYYLFFNPLYIKSADCFVIINRKKQVVGIYPANFLREEKI